MVLSQELIENLSKGELPKSEYSCMNEPSPIVKGGSQRCTQSAPMPPSQTSAPHSMRSRRTANWARPRNSDDGYSRYSHNSISQLLE
jgi:syntaxin-binding protein 1